VHWTFAGNSDYNAASGDATVTLNPVNATIAVVGYSGSYDGNAHGVISSSASGVKGEDLSSLLTVASTTYTNAPGGLVHWTFAGNSDYNAASGDATVTINKASATVVVTPYNVTYDGQAHTATGTATGIKGEDLSAGLNLSGTTHTSAGTYTGDVWSFHDASGNYQDASGTVDDRIAGRIDVISVGSEVKVFDAQTGTLKFDFFPYDRAFTGEVRVAVADVNNDHVPDIITVPGPGGGPLVQVFSGKDFSLLVAFNAPFVDVPNGVFRGGLFVAAGDTNGDGYADIVVAPDATGGPLVQVYSGKILMQTADPVAALMLSFNAYDPGLRSGVHVAAGDVDGDGRAEIITAPGSGGGPLVQIFDGHTGVLRSAFNAYDGAFLGGVFVAAGDVNGDGIADIITGTAEGAPHVKVFSGADHALLDSFMAFAPSFPGGVQVAAVDGNNGGRADVVVGPGPGLPSEVKVFDALSLALLDDFFANDPAYHGGVFVGAG
jgi:hypothetical protein